MIFFKNVDSYVFNFSDDRTTFILVGGMFQSWLAFYIE